MEVGTTLKPGRRGTARLTRKFGDRLVCVRYRYDRVRRRRLKTVELISAEHRWEPPPVRLQDCAPVRVAYQERDLREVAREHSGRWDRVQRAWLVPRSFIDALGLSKRVIRGNSREG